MPASALPSPDPPAQRHRRIWGFAGLVLLGLAAWQGQHIAHLLPRLEQTLEGLGPWAPACYVLEAIALGPLFVPDSIFGVTAGVAFGLGAGFLYYLTANLLSAVLIYGLGRSVLKDPVLRRVADHPRLAAIQGAAGRDATRLTLLLRLVPSNPALTSYALAAVGVPLRSYLIEMLGLVPHLFLTVYLGVAAAHVTRMAGGGHREWSAEGIAMVAGLLVCAIVLVYIVSPRPGRPGAARGGHGGLHPERGRSGSGSGGVGVCPSSGAGAGRSIPRRRSPSTP